MNVATYGYASPGGGGSANASPFRTRLASRLGLAQRRMSPMGPVHGSQFAQGPGDRLTNMLQPGPPGPPNFDYGPPGPIPLRDERPPGPPDFDPPPGPPDFDHRLAGDRNVPNLPPPPGPEGPPELLEARRAVEMERMGRQMAPGPDPRFRGPPQPFQELPVGFGHRYGYARGHMRGRLGPPGAGNEDSGFGRTVRQRKVPFGQPVPQKRRIPGMLMG